MAQDPATADPPFDLESSYYGPGAMAVWYLMFLCLFIKTGQTGHPSKKLSASPDIVIYVLYACLAAGHMAIQITHFDSDAIDQLNGFFFAHFMPPNRRRILQEFPPELQKMVATLNASFQVGVIFLWVVTFPLLFMGYEPAPHGS
ncbi:hypothetical protein B0T18DRAFT_432289 [Schizothecium vesticola]|uniref:Uncharacterized protein n=1 Tax=Schizothecium vesticola TaxID=314040 RepID=A0AA40EKS4_9PEZI|nr:hypothetical protein B0T18DRAFT_432289 [Schizothecium vesticola]